MIRRPLRDAVDYTRQTADFPTRPDSHEPTRSPEISDHDYTQRGNEDGRDTTPEEDARLRQESVSDEGTESFVKVMKDMFPYGFKYPGGAKVAPYAHIWGDPESERKLRQILADDGRTTQQQAGPVDDNELPDDPLSTAGVEKWNRIRKKL